MNITRKLKSWAELLSFKPSRFRIHETSQQAFDADLAVIGEDFRTVGDDIRSVISSDQLIARYKEEGSQQLAYEKFCELCNNLTKSGMFKKPTIPCSREEFDEATGNVCPLDRNTILRDNGSTI